LLGTSALAITVSFVLGHPHHKILGKLWIHLPLRLEKLFPQTVPNNWPTPQNAQGQARACQRNERTRYAAKRPKAHIKILFRLLHKTTKRVVFGGTNFRCDMLVSH
jgi:hypothetical protein